MESIKDSYHRYLRYFLAKSDSTATRYDKYMALSYAVRSEMVDKWIETQQRYYRDNLRRVYFLSMEYIFGRSLHQNIISLDIEDHVASIASDLGFSLDEIYEQEESFDLGNGGKARLAACLQDAMAASSIPATAYGLRYDYGLFRQEVENGVQVEKPYDWMHKGHPWEIIRPEYSCEISYYGRTAPLNNPANPFAAEWKETERVVAVPYDFPVPGYHNQTVNTLRLWCARASEEFLPDYANHGDYLRACDDKAKSGTITRVLFPEEDVLRATELRLKQQFFLISASLKDIFRRFKRSNSDLADLREKIVIQMSGSNCAIAVAEMMRLLVDIENVPWKKAWDVASNVFAYTSHAVSREALESWPVYLMTQVLPRHMEIIYEINQNNLDKMREKFGGNNDLIRELSVIQEGEVKRVKLGHLAAIGSYVINGVSVGQTELLKNTVFPEFSSVEPQKFCAKTNGVSHRRWLLSANRPLSDLITSAIGDSWVCNPQELAKFEDKAGDAAIISKMLGIRAAAKKSLARTIRILTGIEVDPAAMFDVQSKKIHQYKRQAMHVLLVLSRYLRLKKGEKLAANRVHIFAGKAAPSDQLAKQIIKLIHVAASIVNEDPDMDGKMKVVFLPDYGVSLAEKIMPATDLSEQIATPGQEASGTGNAKFALNGSLLMASKSGSNIEIIKYVGEESAFVFGRRADELPEYNQYQPYDLIAANQHLSSIFKLLESRSPASGSQINHSIRPLLSTLMDSDRYFVLLDFDDYCRKQDEADALFNEKTLWTKRGLVNVARCGYFSIDRTIAEYARDIWKVL
jgi:glycogen phosphorylase